MRRVWSRIPSVLLCLAVVYGVAGCSDESTVSGRETGGPEQTRSGSVATPDRPNIVFILTDDQTVENMRYMPLTRELLAGRGTTFENAFVTNSVCCPSRATILRG